MKDESACATLDPGSAPLDGLYVLRLYVSGPTPASARAVVNTRRFCDQYLRDRHTLEIINIADHVGRAREEQVVAAPTLIKSSPLPLRRFIGDMSDVRRLMHGLDLPPPA